MSAISIRVSEWEQVDPSTMPQLRGTWLPNDTSKRLAAEELARRGILELTELKFGLAIKASSYVGRVQLGNLRVTVQPKVSGMKLLALLRYAYGLRDLRLSDGTSYDHQHHAFQDLLVEQLVAEARELLSRGLHRRYLRRDEELASPRGRLDLQKFARRSAAATSVLPCIHHPRSENCLENQVLLAGLVLAARSTTDPHLRSRVRLLVKRLECHVSPVTLSAHLLRERDRHVNRQSAAYSAAFRLIDLLLEGRGISLDEADSSLALPGFMFDMNRFFQALIARFLREHLLGVTLREEFSLRGMMSFVAGWNPRNRRAPQPRPDFALLKEGKVVALLDAKYRDLWERPLPREMLYQLSIYALSQPSCRIATILFPTLTATATPARIAVQDPLLGTGRAHVALRPVDLNYLAALVVQEGTAGERTRVCFAQALVDTAPWAPTSPAASSAHAVQVLSPEPLESISSGFGDGAA